MGLKRLEYDAYLSSDIWQVKREACLKRDRYRCQGCGSDEDLHVHHMTYERFTCEKPTDLVTVCLRCHALIHATHNRMRYKTLSDVTGSVLAKIRGGRPRRPGASAPTHKNQRKGWQRDTDLTWGLGIGEGERHGRSEQAKRRLNGLA